MSSYRPLASALVLLVGIIYVSSASAAIKARSVSVMVEKAVRLDGINVFKIIETGRNELGPYTCSYQITGSAKNGVILAGDIRAYKAVTRSARGGHWTTTREPVAGYMYLFFSGGVPYVDIALLERTESFTVRMYINGLHRVQVPER